MVPSRKFFILFVFLCLSSAAMSYADAEDKSFYFDGDGSGDGNHISTEFPTDDEDIDEGSGRFVDDPLSTSSDEMTVTTVVLLPTSKPYNQSSVLFDDEAQLYTKTELPSTTTKTSVPPLVAVESEPKVADTEVAQPSTSSGSVFTSRPDVPATSTIATTALSRILLETEISQTSKIDVKTLGKPDLVNIDVSESIIPVKSGPKKINEEPIEIEPIEKNIARDDGTNEEVKSEPGIGVGVAGAASMHFIAAIVVGGCIGLLFAVCVVMLLVYRMRKKDEGSYALEYGLDKKPQGAYEYTKGVDSKEYFA